VDAVPSAAVVAVWGDTVALPDVTLNVTTTPDAGVPSECDTVTASGVDSVLPIVPC
jgi:hypothetical protein